MDDPSRWLSWKTLISWKAFLVYLIIIAGLSLGYYGQNLFQSQRDKNDAGITVSGQPPQDQNEDPYIIDFSSQGLTAFPDFLLDRSEITDLILSYNDIPDIPTGISGISKLRVLDMRYNRLSGALGPEITQLGLVDVNLSHNQLTAIPPQISQVSSLRYLDLSHNQISTIPDSITALPNLKWLDLAGNPIANSQIANLRQAMPSTIINY